MKRGCAVLALAAAYWIPMPSAASAQLVGDRVRVTIPEPLMFEAVVTRITPDELELALPGGESRVVATRDILRLERRGGRRQWKAGFVVGATLGAAMVLPLGGYAYAEPDGPPSLGELIAFKAVVVAYVAPIFGAVGTLVGGVIKLPGWQPISGWPRSGIPPGLHAEMRTLPGGRPVAELGMRLRF